MTQVWPGGTIGILGGGQLARMLALEARCMGYRIAILDPEPGGPAAQVADIQITVAFDDAEAAAELAKHSDVITIDTEHFPSEHLARLGATASRTGRRCSRTPRRACTFTASGAPGPDARWAMC